MRSFFLYRDQKKKSKQSIADTEGNMSTTPKDKKGKKETKKVKWGVEEAKKSIGLENVKSHNNQ